MPDPDLTQRLLHVAGHFGQGVCHLSSKDAARALGEDILALLAELERVRALPCPNQDCEERKAEVERLRDNGAKVEGFAKRQAGAADIEIARVRADAAAKIDEAHTLLRQSQAERDALAACVAKAVDALDIAVQDNCTSPYMSCSTACPGEMGDWCASCCARVALAALKGSEDA